MYNFFFVVKILRQNYVDIEMSKLMKDLEKNIYSLIDIAFGRNRLETAKRANLSNSLPFFKDLNTRFVT